MYKIVDKKTNEVFGWTSSLYLADLFKTAIEEKCNNTIIITESKIIGKYN